MSFSDSLGGLKAVLSSHTFVAVRQFEFEMIRRRRSLISAQGWSAARTLGSTQTHYSTLKGFLFNANAFSVDYLFCIHTQGWRCANPGLKLANAFGVKVSERFG